MRLCKNEADAERIAWLNGLSYYQRVAYFAVARNSIENGDTDVDFVLVTEPGAHKIAPPSRSMILILTGSFELLGKKYVEGVVRIDPFDMDNASAVCRFSGDDLRVDCHRGVDAFDVFRALDSFRPNPNGDGIACPYFPGVDYREAQR